MRLPALMLLCGITSIAHAGDCITSAARCFTLNPLLIKAIIWNESGFKQQSINVNLNKTEDVGLMQINSIHFKRLGEMGVSEQQLRTNACANIFSGSWILSQEIKQAGYSWSGVGRYHSRTPQFRERYASKLISTIQYNYPKLNRKAIHDDLSDNWLAKFSPWCRS